MSKVPRLPSAVEGSPANFQTMFAHAPALAGAFARLYGELWESSLGTDCKELIRVRGARKIDCFL